MVMVFLFKQFVSITYKCVSVSSVLILNVFLGVGRTKSFENDEEDHGL